MSELVNEWFNSKKKTYWKAWECNDTNHPEGTWSWVLFFTSADLDPTYHYGIAGSESEAHSEIKWAIESYLDRRDML